MQLIEKCLVLSPSDLVGYLACPHLTQLDLATTVREINRPSLVLAELADSSMTAQ